MICRHGHQLTQETIGHRMDRGRPRIVCLRCQSISAWLQTESAQTSMRFFDNLQALASRQVQPAE